MEYIRLLFISEFKINIMVPLYYFLHIIYTLYFYIFYIMPLIVKPISAELVKDKDFLGTRDDHGAQYGCTVPPLRSPADLRVLQQALRMGIVMGIEVDSDSVFLPQILEKQILPPFHIGQMTCFRWEKHGFSGQKIYFSFPMPLFISEGNDDD